MTKASLLRALLSPALAIALAPSSPAQHQISAQDSSLAANRILEQATAQAVQEHKNILLVFSASWCIPCHMFESFLTDRTTGPIIDKNFVVARFDVGDRAGDKRHTNTPGAEDLSATLQGTNAGYPFLVIEDPSGKVIVNSYRPTAGKKPSTPTNIGYPATAAEIDWFMEMLHQSAPSISESEARTIRDWLRKRGS